MEELLKRKLLEGTLTKEEWDALAVADRERTVVEVLREAVAEAVATERMTNDGRLPAGAFFSDQEKPPEGSETLLPAGYALTVEGVWRAAVVEKSGNLKAYAEHLTLTPFFVAARDAGSGRVRVMVRLRGAWYGEWVAASRLSVNKLADWFVFPVQGVKARELVEYMRACIACAPFAVAHDEIAVAAVEILREFFPGNGAGVEFPAFRAFPEVRQKCELLGVDAMKVREWWCRMGLIQEGASRVVRLGRGREAKPTRLVVFTPKVREFLQSDEGRKTPVDVINARTA